MVQGCCALNLGQVEFAGLEDFAEIHFALLRGDDFGPRVELLDQGRQRVNLLLLDQVDLVQHNHVCKFELGKKEEEEEEKMKRCGYHHEEHPKV